MNRNCIPNCHCTARWRYGIQSESRHRLLMAVNVFFSKVKKWKKAPTTVSHHSQTEEEKREKRKKKERKKERKKEKKIHHEDGTIQAKSERGIRRAAYERSHRATNDQQMGVALNRWDRSGFGSWRRVNSFQRLVASYSKRLPGAIRAQ